MINDGSKFCALCSDRLPEGEDGICEKHLAEPMDERWNDCDENKKEQK